MNFNPKFISSAFRKGNNNGEGFNPEGCDIGNKVAEFDGLAVYERNGYITVVGDLHGPWAIEIPSEQEAIESCLEQWDGISAWTWDIRAEALKALKENQLISLISIAMELVYMVAQYDLEITREDALEYLKTNREALMQELQESLEESPED